MLAAPEAVAILELAADGPSGVRLWWASREEPAGRSAPDLEALSDAERERVALFPDAVRGGRFAFGRVVLRRILGEVLDVPPHALRFSYGPDGRPALIGVSAGRLVSFNLSHARDLVVVAVSETDHVGVDVSWTGGKALLDRVVERFFSPPERAAYVAASPERRRRVFARIWVRKEAWLKGRGVGISEGIFGTDFSAPALDDNEEVFRADVVQHDGWSIGDVHGLPPAYVASVAYLPVER